MSKFIVFFTFLIVISTTLCKEAKNILVNVFPGGKSHNFVLKELFDYTLEHEKDYEYKFHILVHNWDLDAWPNDGPYKTYGYGDMLLYEMIFNEALDLVRKDPVFGYSKFNKAMVHVYEQFLDSNHLEELKKYNFEMLITDIPNFTSKFLFSELKIRHNMYCSPPSLPNLFYEYFEFNTSYLPAIGTRFTDIMSFPERFVNSVYVMGTKVMFWLFMGEQADTFKKYGYPLENSNVFIPNSFVIIQYPTGVWFNLSLPPNFLMMNAVTPKPANPIANSQPEIDAFLKLYKQNIYFTQGTIVKIIDFDKILEIFNHFKNVGFILSFKKHLINDELLKKFPKNVLLISWVKQNDLLGDKRLNAFITHGGCNSVSESIYHEKPMIVLGVTLDQVNTAAVVKKRNVGVVINEIGQINSDKLISAIDEVLQPEKTNKYLENVRKYGKILRSNKDARKEFMYWVKYGFKLGYENLMIKAYTEYSFIELYNYDIFFVWFAILFIIIWILKKIFICIFCSCKTQKRIKYKSE
jgi:hypothetical protein